MPGSAGRSWGDFLAEISSHVAPAPGVLQPKVTNPPDFGTDSSTERGAARRALRSSSVGDAGARPGPRSSAGAVGSRVLSLPLLRATPPAPVYSLQQGAEPWFCTARSQSSPTLPLSYGCTQPPTCTSLMRGSESLRALRLPPRGFSAAAGGDGVAPVSLAGLEGEVDTRILKRLLLAPAHLQLTPAAAA